MSKKTFTLQIQEPVLTTRIYEFEREFETEGQATEYLQEIIASGAIPDDIQEEYNELSYESETYPAAINGNSDFPGLRAGIVSNSCEDVIEDTKGQRAFFWDVVGGELHVRWVGGYQATGKNILIAAPAEDGKIRTILFDGIPATGTLFYYGERVWKTLFTFKQPDE